MQMRAEEVRKDSPSQWQPLTQLRNHIIPLPSTFLTDSVSTLLHTLSSQTQAHSSFQVSLSLSSFIARL